jgi:hypothetical protein
MIAAETPSASRTLLVAPSRLAAVDPDVAAAVLADTGRLPWLCPVPLADVAAGRERCAELPDEQGPAAAHRPTSRIRRRPRRRPHRAPACPRPSWTGWRT